MTSVKVDAGETRRRDEKVGAMIKQGGATLISRSRHELTLMTNQYYQTPLPASAPITLQG